MTSCGNYGYPCTRPHCVIPQTNLEHLEYGQQFLEGYLNLKMVVKFSSKTIVGLSEGPSDSSAHRSLKIQICQKLKFISVLSNGRIIITRINCDCTDRQRLVQGLVCACPQESGNLRMWKSWVTNLPVFVWVWNLVSYIEGGIKAEGVWEWGVEENIWA